jgi:predicted esterase
MIGATIVGPALRFASWSLSLVLPLALAASAAAASSLPSVDSGHRPGPDVLYAPPTEAPQLENAPPWRAKPILVSGASAYREGEFLYQDFLYDDHGAAGVTNPADLTSFGFTTFAGSPWTGTLTYPTDPVFANNAADLVELRIGRVGRAATAFRVTLNSLIDPERTAFTIALGSSDELRSWPHGAGVRSPAELFLTVHGGTAELREAATGESRSPSPSVEVDVRRRQFDVRVPQSAWDPGERQVRLAAGFGLWDQDAGRYLAPQTSATETAPGGAAPSGAALFNMAFRFDEPLPDWELIRKGYTIADWLALVKADGSWWRERRQAEALASGDVSAFFAQVDFRKLAKRLDDESNVPQTGPIDRILASRFSFGQGIDWTQGCGRPSAPPCVGPFVGQLQPYGLYVPDKPRPADGWGLTFLLHGWTVNHNGALANNNQSQFGERGDGSLVVTPLARGHDGEYVDMAEADVFEVWADLARHYKLDPDRAAATGYSMGAGGAYFLSARWPDLFSRTVLGGAVPEGDFMKSLRNVPILSWIGALDEGTDLSRQEATAGRLGELGLRFIFDQFPTADHLTLVTNDEWGPAAEFLGEHRVDRNPHHVTYVVDPRRDSARGQVVADHAYWLSELRVRNPDANPIGEIDAHSAAFGVGDPPALGVTRSAGILEGGAHGPMPYVRRQQDWGPTPPTLQADRLVVRATNLASVTVDTARARLSCKPDLEVTTDGPLRVALAPCGRVITFGAND